LYDLEGRRVDRSEERFVAHPEDIPEGEIQKLEADREALSPAVIDISEHLDDATVETRPAVFLGYWADHYGHFVTDWSSRLWALERLDLAGMPVMPPYPGFGAHWSKPFVGAMLSASGIDDRATSPITRPTIFENVTLVENALQGGSIIYSCADDVHRKVARSALGATSEIEGKKIFLSRSRLKARMRDIAGEAEIEDEFNRLGFVSVIPEDLSLRQQIEIFNHASVIAGFVGSAFHTGMFSLRSFTGTLIVLCDDRWPNFRLMLQNALKNSRCVFMRVAGVTHRPGMKPLIETNRELLDIGLEHLGEGVL